MKLSIIVGFAFVFCAISYAILHQCIAHCKISGILFAFDQWHKWAKNKIKSNLFNCTTKWLTLIEIICWNPFYVVVVAIVVMILLLIFGSCCISIICMAAYKISPLYVISVNDKVVTVQYKVRNGKVFFCLLRFYSFICSVIKRKNRKI